MRYYNALEIAEIFEVSPQTARWWIRDKRLPAEITRLDGHRWQFIVSETDLYEFMENYHKRQKFPKAIQAAEPATPEVPAEPELPEVPETAEIAEPATPEVLCETKPAATEIPSILDEEYITVQEAVEKLHTTIQVVYRALKKGSIKGIKFGDDYRVCKSELVKSWSVKEIAQALKCSRATIDRHINRGLLKCTIRNGRRCVTEEQLRDYIKPAKDGV